MPVICGRRRVGKSTLIREFVKGKKCIFYTAIESSAQFLIRPFNYRTSGEFVKEYSCDDKAVVYGITGGIPKYLELFDSKKTLRENIIDLFLK